MAMSDARTIVFVGTYTAPSGTGEGIYRFGLDRDTGALEQLGVATDVASPSYLALGPGGSTLYAVAEIGQDSAGVVAYAVEGDGAGLRRLGSQPTKASAPCYVRLGPSGRSVMVANYSGGTVAVFPLGADGTPEPMSSEITHQGSSVNPDRQREPHPHSIVPTPEGRFALVPDLGADRIVIYRLEDEVRLVPHGEAPAAAAGAGPRHLSFDLAGRHVFVGNELDSTIAAYAWDGERGALEPLRALSTLPPSFQGVNYVADVHIHPSGRYLYVSNRGHDSIAGFAIDEEGRMEAIGHESTGGEWPRNFTIDASGRLLLAANQNTNSIVAFSVDEATGALRPTGARTEVPSPSCVVIVE